MTRPLRYGLLTAALVLAVCGVLAAASWLALSRAEAVIATATARTEGTVGGATATGHAVELRWTRPGTTPRTDAVELAGTLPPAGTRTQVAYDPAHLDAAPLIPGAAVLVDADRDLTDLALAGAVAVVVVVLAGWQLPSRRWAARRPGRPLAVRRVRYRSGLLSRSYLETDAEPQRWIPVHFDPVLVGLPAPTTVLLHGDPWRHRLVGVRVDGRVLPVSGGVRRDEPRGRRTDNPARPDAAAAGRGAALAGLRRQLRTDLPLLVAAPVVALLWTYLDGGGPLTWVGASALLGALALLYAAVRGSDPT